ncbi:ANTH domain-containing protein [Trichoderma camerunense]
MSSFEKSVKGATKIKNAPPKTKYIEHILVGTHSGEAGIAEVLRALQNRLHDSTWTVVFKSLMTVHLMIREGSPEATLAYLARHRNMLAISNFADAQTQGRNIRHYANYLIERVRAYRDTKTDWVRAPESRLERLTVEKGLLRETEVVQHQLTALLKCDLLDQEPETEITIAVFRLLVLDLLPLFQVLNQGLINILGHFFEMSKPDADRAMEIYRTFTKHTDYVVQYLSTAKQWQHHTRVEVPKLKHAPVNLGRQLEEYLNDPDFEIHRRQYLAEQEAKKGNKGSKSKATKSGIDFPKAPSPAANNPFPLPNSGNATAKVESKPQANKGPDPDLIDFFDSIEQNQIPMQVTAQQPPMQVPIQAQGQDLGFQAQNVGLGFQQGQFVQQPQGFVQGNGFPQQDNGFIQPPAQLQPTITGFSGFGPQLGPIPQNTVANFQTPIPQQQQPPVGLQPTGLQPVGLQPTGLQPSLAAPGMTNPFRQSMLVAQPTSSSSQLSTPTSSTPTLNRQSTNPFARSTNSPGQNTGPFQAQPVQPQPTSTNPFARNVPTEAPQQQQQQQQQLQDPQQQSSGLAPQPTGVTNPFRQGAFVNHATGMGWQHNQTPIGGGIDHIQTVPVFPRPAQQTPWQQ